MYKIDEIKISPLYFLKQQNFKIHNPDSKSNKKSNYSERKTNSLSSAQAEFYLEETTEFIKG